MSRIATLILALAVASTGSAASAQTCLSVLGCAPESTGTSTATQPNRATGDVSGTPLGAAGYALSGTSAPLLYDGFGNLRASPGTAQSDADPVTESAADLATQNPLVGPKGLPAASDPRAPGLQAIPQDPD